MFFINGKPQSELPADDRATQFGDGCFTTARVTDGQIHLLSAHLQRLRDACLRLMIPFSEWSALEQEMVSYACGHKQAVLKVLLSRGSGGRGYSGGACVNPTRILSVSAWPAHFSRWREEGITLTLSPVRLGRNPLLAGIKHLNRLEQVLIRAHLEQTQADDALVLDSDGWLTECCAANIFWRKGREVYTPRVDQAGVNGIMRQHCIQLLATSYFTLHEVNAPEAALAQADEVIICNALMPVVPVRTYGEQCWNARELYHFLAPRCEQLIAL